jgi:uncharacterized membrane protein
MNDSTSGVDRSAEQLAVGLGWFSIALGVAKLAAPRSVARRIGVRDDESTVALLRTFGARELGNGLAILARPQEAKWLWGRVGGDALDLACLSTALSADDTRLGRTALATVAVLGVTALDVLCAQRLSRQSSTGDETAQPDPYMTESMTINQSIEIVYEAWRDLESLAFMRGAEITESRDQEMCSWCSPDDTIGWVRFERAPGARGTEIHVEVRQKPRPPGQRVVRALGLAPDQQIREDLRRFKQLLEAGEITVSDGPGLRRPAQPSSSAEQLTAFSSGV